MINAALSNKRATPDASVHRYSLETAERARA
ncbi:hypothetical protein SAMN05216355_101494 [Actinomyces ruminicola]|uniref:Uncharacterized protein n=1 Tax=Actinomyces ruminicola TaxID=332524 RepID=A0A1H0A276_9ACTO|nr:hypothetical protein SAMN05216355_101494 [Actinomyces ruminicola]